MVGLKSAGKAGLWFAEKASSKLASLVGLLAVSHDGNVFERVGGGLVSTGRAVLGAGELVLAPVSRFVDFGLSDAGQLAGSVAETAYGCGVNVVDSPAEALGVAALGYGACKLGSMALRGIRTGKYSVPLPKKRPELVIYDRSKVKC